MKKLKAQINAHPVAAILVALFFLMQVPLAIYDIKAAFKGTSLLQEMGLIYEPL